MRHTTPGILLVLASLLLVWSSGCRQLKPEEEREPDRQEAVAAGPHLTEEARTGIGIVTAPVQR